MSCRGGALMEKLRCCERLRTVRYILGEFVAMRPREPNFVARGKQRVNENFRRVKVVGLI